MKPVKYHPVLIAIFIACVLFLTACKINLTTEIKSDGSGVYTQEIGFSKDEASIAGMGGDTSTEDFCSNANSQSGGSELPPGTQVRQEERGDGETWCIFETSFQTLENLRAIYGTSDLQVNSLEIVDGKLIYDVNLDMSGDGVSASLPLGDIYWIVTMPGNVTNHNATETDGTTLKWRLTTGQNNNMHAESDTSGTSLSDNTIWYIAGVVLFLCLCCLLPLAVAGVVFFLVRRKKNAADADSPIA